MRSNSKGGLVFGIYPGGAAGSDDGIAAGPPDDPEQVERCLDELQGDSRPFVIRVSERFSDLDRPSRWPPRTPPNYERYAGIGRPLDLVVMFQSAGGDVPGYLRFVRNLIERHAACLYSVQITEEANFTGGPDAIDGPYPNVRQALIEGVLEAKKALRRLGKHGVKVGFNSTPTFGPGAGFWSSLGSLGGTRFVDALDYVGLDFFPDVFRPAAPDGEKGDVQESASAVLEAMRREWLSAAGIGPQVPIHIAENGWPTGPARSAERQSQVLETIIRTTYEARERLNIERYTMFDLRDADSSNPEVAGDIFRHFGLTHDDYSPKPAYESYRRLIQELGVR
jgi:hypothetical protein